MNYMIFHPPIFPITHKITHKITPGMTTPRRLTWYLLRGDKITIAVLEEPLVTRVVLTPTQAWRNQMKEEIQNGYTEQIYGHHEREHQFDAFQGGGR